MQKEYELQGMSCGGCVNIVIGSLLQVPDVTEAEVQLNPQRAVITMNKPIGIDELQSHLKKAGNYSIKEIDSNIACLEKTGRRELKKNLFTEIKKVIMENRADLSTKIEKAFKKSIKQIVNKTAKKSKQVTSKKIIIPNHSTI